MTSYFFNFVCTCAAYFSPSTCFCAVGGVAKYCQIPPSFVTVHPLPLLVGYDNLAGGSYWCLVITFWETELLGEWALLTDREFPLSVNCFIPIPQLLC